MAQASVQYFRGKKTDSAIAGRVSIDRTHSLARRACMHTDNYHVCVSDVLVRNEKQESNANRELFVLMSLAYNGSHEGSSPPDILRGMHATIACLC